MADKDTEFNITVGAEADVNSAKKAAKDISHAIESSVKGGRIEVPVDITVPIDKNKDKLTKAQKDITATISKMMTKGFSASGKDIDTLTSKFNEFAKAFDQAGKGRQNKIFREIRKQVEDLQKSYKDFQKSTRTGNTKINRSSKKSKNLNLPSDEEINANIRSEQKRKLKGLKQASPAGYGSGWVDPSRTNTREARLSEISSYRSGMSRQMQLSEKETQKDMLNSLEVHKYATKEELAAEIEKRHKTDALKGRNSNRLSSQEKALQLSDDIRKNILPKLLGEIQKSTDDAEIESLTQKLFTTLETVSKLNQDAGKLIVSDVKKDIGIIMGKLGFTTKGNIGGTNGGDKTEASKDPKIVAILKDLFNEVSKKGDAINRELIKLAALEEKSNTKSKPSKEIDSFANRLITETRNNKAIQKQNTQEIAQAVAKSTAAIEKQTSYDKIENSAERVADSTSGKKTESLIKDTERDLNSGFNTDANTERVVALLEQIKNSLQGLNGGLTGSIFGGTRSTNKMQSLESMKQAYDMIQKLFKPLQKALPAPGGQLLLPPGKRLNRSTIETSVMDPSKASKLSDAFERLFGVTENYEKIMAKTSEEQDELLAKRIKYYGTNSNRFPAETGDKSRIYRSLALWRGRDKFSSMFQDFKTTPGVRVNTTEITKALAKALSGAEMFKAQTGGWKNNLLAAGTGGLAFLFQPSLEKTRAQADAVNTIMADIRENMNAILQDILLKESALSGMEAQGDIAFNEDGSVLYGTTEAKMTAAQLEESKLVLQSLLADVGMVDDVVGRTGGKLNEIVKQLGFTAPLLRKDNAILANINAGLDKSGKALKFQRRSQEILNYSFQLMGRHIGQIFKNLMTMLNPINLIKKAFQDFASYDVKWQRTMNVIKYNIRRVIRPFMEWIAQQIVNIIGLVNALIKGIGNAFGQNWDLFDQSAANAEKMREELEAAANVTAGFDELHDIGSDNSAAGDLMGDIYTPQWTNLYDMIEGFSQKVVSFFKNIFDTVKNWNFWDWLILAGAALTGFLALKALISWFSVGKNPLQTVANGFSFLEKAVGWSLLILSFTAFVKVLGEFVEIMKSANWEDIAKSLATLGGAFLILGGTTAGLIALSSALKILAPTLLGLAAMIGAFTLFTLTLTYFIDTVKDIESSKLSDILTKLSGALLVLVGSVTLLIAVLAAIMATGIGALAVVALAAVLAAIASIIAAIADLITAIGKYSDEITAIIEVGAKAINNVIESTAKSTMIVLQPILDFISNIIDKIMHLKEVIAHEIGETIRTVIKTTGDVIIGIIREIMSAIPNLLNSILHFVGSLGPAIERSADSIMRTITKVVNFCVSAVEYLINLAVDGVNAIISAINSLSQYVGINIPRVGKTSISRFVPQYEKGTNYVPNDGLAYLHQGEAVIPSKYNKPYENEDSSKLNESINQLTRQVEQIGNMVNQGVRVQGQFVQKGSDLVAVVQKANNKLSNNILNNKVYAR